MGSRWVVVRLAAGLVSLGSIAYGGAASAQEAQPAGQSVSIIDFAFQPSALTIPAGTRVTWTNNGQAPHTASSSDSAFDSGRLEAGASFSFTFSAAGNFPYVCNIHPQMRGTITVQAAGSGAAQATATRTATAAPPTGGTLPPAPSPATVAAPGGQRPAGPVATPAAQRPAGPAAPAAAPRPAAPAALPRTGTGATGDAPGAPLAAAVGAVFLALAGAAGIRRLRRG